jgi:hypothetical protein
MSLDVVTSNKSRRNNQLTIHEAKIGYPSERSGLLKSTTPLRWMATKGLGDKLTEISKNSRLIPEYSQKI